MIELAELISRLRQELEAATEAGKDAALKFELGEIELEVTVAVGREAGAGGKVRFWVVDLSTDARMSGATTQRIKMVLQPRASGEPRQPVLISGAARVDER